MAYDILGDENKAIQCFQEYLVLATKSQDIRRMAIASWNLGRAYFKLGDREKAIPLLESYIDYLTSIKHPSVDVQAESLKLMLAEPKPSNKSNFKFNQ